MFVQEARSDTFSSDGAGNFTLTLRNITPYTVYFSDRPERIAVNVPMADFIKIFSWDKRNPPNAAIALEAGAEDEDTLIVSLRDPRYDAVAGTLAYRASPLRNFTGEGLAFYSAWKDKAVPDSFAEVNLFIDDCPDREYNCEPDGNFVGMIERGSCWSRTWSGCWASRDLSPDCNAQFPACQGRCHATTEHGPH